ncbi:MAG: acetylglutamate kinase [Dehalococcoidia bacterium]
MSSGELQREGQKPIVVKIGGGPLGEGDTLYQDLVSLQRDGQRVVVVHGGGNVVSRWQEIHGIEARFVRGLRVTDLPSLEVATAVLAGLVNKGLVASLQAEGGNAVGLSGVDGGILEARVVSPELGHVGRIATVHRGLLEALLREGYIPVVAPIAARGASNKQKGEGLLNVNADTVAAEVAAALKAHRLIYLTDVPGVRDGAGGSIPYLSIEETQRLIETGVITEGMIPKVEGCLRAARASVPACILDGREPHALLEAVAGGGIGTRFD